MAIIWVSLQIGMLGFFSFETSPCHHVSTADMMVFCYMFPPKNNPSIVVHICFLYVDSCLWLTSLAGSTPPLPSVHSKNSCEHEEQQDNRVSQRNCCGYIKFVAFTVLYIWKIKLIWFQPVIIYRFWYIYIYDMYIYTHIYILSYIYTYHISNINRYHISITSCHTIVQY